MSLNEKPKISVLINSLNEEKNIRNCLESVKWADEIIVVDSNSIDKTIEIAKKYTKKIYKYKKHQFPEREFIIKKATNEWVLFVDCDEIISSGLTQELYRIIDSGLGDIVKIPRKNYWFGYLMNGCGWGALQDKQIRFGRKSAFIVKNVTHQDFSIKPNVKVYTINDVANSIVHFPYLDFDELTRKINFYTTCEARNIFLGEKKKPLPIVLDVLKEFLVRFIKLNGYRDGLLGLNLTVMMMFYRFLIHVKYYLMKKYGVLDIKDKVRIINSNIVSKYLKL